jgi:hypothetical protein
VDRWRRAPEPDLPVQPDPISGMHCWHQKVTLQKASPAITMVTSKSIRKRRWRSTANGCRRSPSP